MSVFCKAVASLFGAVVFISFAGICLTFAASIRVDGVLVLSFSECTTANDSTVGLVVYLPARMAEVQEVRSQNRGVATLFVFQLRLILFQLFFVLCWACA